MNLDSRPFILLGRSQLNAFQGQIERALDAWLQHWFEGSVVPPKMSVSQLEKTDSDCFDKASIWNHLAIEKSSIYFHFDGLSTSAFLPSMLGLQQGKQNPKPDAELHGEIVRPLLHDFISRWWKPAVVADPVSMPDWESSKLPEALYERGSGAVLLTLTLGVAKILFIVPAKTLQRLPLGIKFGTAIEKRPVSRISEVLGKESMRVFVAIDAAEKVPFSALADLNVGDVILLNRKVRDPFNLINANGMRMGECHIGRRGENRAVHIAATVAAGNLKGISSKS